MTQDEFLVKIGVQIDNTQMQNQVQDFLEQARVLLNKSGLQIDEIQIGDTEGVIDALNDIGARISSVVDESGELNRIGVSFTDAQGRVVQLNSALEETLRMLSSDEIRDLNSTAGSIQNFLNNKTAVDANGAQITSASKAEDIAAVQGTATSTSVQNANQLLQERQKLLSQITSLTNQMDTAARSGNDEYASGIQNVIDKLNERLNAINNIESVQQAVKNEDNTSQEVANLQRQNTAYQNILKITQQIATLKEQQRSSTSNIEQQQIQSQIDVLNEKLNVEKNIYDYTQNIDQVLAVNRAGNIATENEQYKTQESLLSEIKSLYDQKLAAEEKAATASTGSEEQKYYETLANNIQTTIDKEENQIAAQQNNAAALSDLKTIQDQYNQSLTEMQNKVDAQNTSKAQVQTVKDISTALKEYQSTLKENQKLEESKSSETYFNQLKNNETKLTQLQTALQQYGQGLVTIDTNTNKATIDQTKMATALGTNQKAIDNLKTAVNTYNQSIDQLNAKDQDFVDQQKVEAAIKKLEELTKAKKTYIELKAKGADNSVLQEQSNIVSKLTSELNSLTNEQLSNGQAVSQSTAYTEKYTKAQQELSAATAKANTSSEQQGSIMGNLSTKFSTALANVVKYSAAQLSLQQVITKTIGTMQDLNEQMTNIRMVTGDTAEGATEMMVTYSEMAKELGTTTTAVAEGKLLCSL